MHISIHAPPRGATCERVSEQAAVRFQFTPLREGRHPACSLAVLSSYFNSRPSARGDEGWRNLWNRRPYFNSRPSARGDKIAAMHREYGKISIHAPPRGATYTSARKVCRTSNFNSRPSARGDPVARSRIMNPAYFNSRPSARGDHFRASIHAQAKFQFTPLREGRQARCTVPFSFSNFNSRPSARGDLFRFQCRNQSAFQFTPLREGRRRIASQYLPLFISIHAPPRGATAKDMQFLQIFCSTLTNQHGLTIVPRNLSRLFW